MFETHAGCAVCCLLRFPSAPALPRMQIRPPAGAKLLPAAPEQAQVLEAPEETLQALAKVSLVFVDVRFSLYSLVFFQPGNVIIFDPTGSYMDHVALGDQYRNVDML